MPNVRRLEEPLRGGRNQRLLGSRWRGDPGGPSIGVAIGGRYELPRPDEPARLAVTQTLGRLWKGETDRPESSVAIGLVVGAPDQIARIRLFFASCVNSARPSASSSGGMYMPNRPR
jgi:hypothetical protein